MEWFSLNEGGENRNPSLSRGVSDTLAAVCDVDIVRAREALVLSSGDMDAAAMFLMTGLSSGSGTEGVICGEAMSPEQELAEMGGLRHGQARDLLAAAGGDLEQAKSTLLETLGICTEPEKYSCLLHPAVLAACPVCCESPESCADLVQLQQCGHTFCVECLRGWITAEAAGSSSGSVQCPQPECLQCVAHSELKELLVGNEALFRLMDRRALELLTGQCGGTPLVARSLLCSVLSTCAWIVCVLLSTVRTLSLAYPARVFIYLIFLHVCGSVWQHPRRVCTCAPRPTAPTSCPGTRRRRTPRPA